MAGNNQEPKNTPSYVNDPAIQAANQQVQSGLDSGDKEQTSAGMKNLEGALLNQGIVYPSASATAAAQAQHAAAGNQPQAGGTSGNTGNTVVLTGDVAKDDAAREQRIKDRKGSRADAAVSSMTANAAAMYQAGKQQTQQQINYATDQGIKKLQRAEEDAQKKFQTQQNQVDINEAKALDNQALYAEARGDRGGIGQAQYGQIQATAMNNRRAINTARTELATTTARQIADLRAQGEFQKADALLQLTQTYLGQLNEIQKWGAQFSLSEAQFNAQLEQWAANLAVQEAALTGVYKGEKTWSVKRSEMTSLAEAGIAAAEAGYELTDAQKAAVRDLYGIDDATLASMALDAKTAKEKEEATPIAKNALTTLQSGYELTEEQTQALWTVYRMGPAQIAAIQKDAAAARVSENAMTVAQKALSMLQSGLSISKEQEQALWDAYRIGSAQIAAIKKAATKTTYRGGGGGPYGGGGSTPAQWAADAYANGASGYSIATTLAAAAQDGVISYDDYAATAGPYLAKDMAGVVNNAVGTLFSGKK